MTPSDITVSFKCERIKQFMELRDIDHVTLWTRVTNMVGFKVCVATDVIVIEAVAKVLEIPIDFFYFRYSISMENWIYVLHCYETNKTITIKSKQ